MTWRRLGVLIRALPSDSLTQTALRDELEQFDKQSKIARLRERQAYWDEQQRLRGEPA